MIAPHEIHGYTADDITDLARSAVMSNRHRLLGDLDECIAAAWSAVAEALLTADEEPERFTLYQAAFNAASRENDSLRSFRGAARTRDGGGQLRNFGIFWNQRFSVPGHEDGIVDRLTVPQIMVELTSIQRQILNAYVRAEGDTRQVAEWLGIPETRARERLRSARAAFSRLWFEGETPPAKHYRMTRSARQFIGRKRSPNGTYAPEERAA